MEKMISRSNYEIVFIDYFDGKLDNIRVEELFKFLSDNQDLKEEFDQFMNVNAEPDLTLEFSGKEKLKKETITYLNYKTWLIGYLENDLSSDSKNDVEHFLLKHPELRRDLEILKLTRLTPDYKIIFNKKYSIKRGGNIIPFNTFVKRSISVAAILLLISVSYFIIREFNSIKPLVVDHQENKKIEIKKTEDLNKKDQVFPVKNNNRNKIKITKPLSGGEATELALQSKKSDQSIGNIKQKENQIDTVPDLINPVQVNINSGEIVENNQTNSVAKTGIQLKVEAPSINVTPLKITTNNLSQVFSEEDIKELENIRNQNQTKSDLKTKSLLDLAENELQKFSNSSAISASKKENPINNSVTYALGIGKSFSISHTSVR